MILEDLLVECKEKLTRLWKWHLNPWKPDQDKIFFSNLQKRIARVPNAELARTALREALANLSERHPNLQIEGIHHFIQLLNQGPRDPFPNLSSSASASARGFKDLLKRIRGYPSLRDDADALEQWHRIYINERSQLGLTDNEVNEAVNLASKQSQSSTEASTPPLEAPPARYNNLATALGVIGTLGGGITYAALLQLGVNCQDPTIRGLLGYASVLFFGSLFTSIPVILAVGNADEKQDLPSRTVRFLWLQIFFAAVMIAVAYVCLLVVVLEIALPGPYFVGLAIFVAAVLWCAIALAKLHRYTWVLQISMFVILLLICILVPKGKIPTVNDLSKKHSQDACYPPPASTNCCCPLNPTIVMDPIVELNVSNPWSARPHQLDVRLIT